MMNSFRNKKSLLSKIILFVVIAAVGLFYIEVSWNRNSGLGFKSDTKLIAKVDDEAISQQYWATEIEIRSKELTSKFFQGQAETLPQETLMMLKESLAPQILDSLIINKVFAKAARELGITLSNPELTYQIVKHYLPVFNIQGQFDEQAYLNFKKNYFLQTGEDTELYLKDELWAEKFQKLLKRSVAISDTEVTHEFLLSNTKLQLQKIVYDPTPQTTSESQSAETLISESPPESKPETQPYAEYAKNTAEISQFLTAKEFKKEAFEELKKKFNLTTEEIPAISIREKNKILGNLPFSVRDTLYDCVLELRNNQKTLCTSGLEDKMYFFKLIERSEADLSKLPAEKEKIEQRLLTQRQNQLLKTVAAQLQLEVKIQTENLENNQ